MNLTKPGFFEVNADFRESAAKIIQHHTTALIKVSSERGGSEQNIHIGSGTFVKIESYFGILTANHVANALDGDCWLGLTIDTAEHKFVVPKRSLSILVLAQGEKEDQGPDLSFIRIPNELTGRIGTSMIFHNLTLHRQKMLADPPPIDTGWWVLGGVPEMGTKKEPSQRGFKEVRVLEHFACEGNIDKPLERNGLDYVDMPIDLSSYHNTPPSFSGMSGGGLWQVLLEGANNNQLRVKSYLLSGVIFYQTELIKNKRSVRSHFRNSLYSFAYNEIVDRLRVR